MSSQAGIWSSCLKTSGGCLFSDTVVNLRSQVVLEDTEVVDLVLNNERLLVM